MDQLSINEFSGSIIVALYLHGQSIDHMAKTNWSIIRKINL